MPQIEVDLMKLHIKTANLYSPLNWFAIQEMTFTSIPTTLVAI